MLCRVKHVKKIIVFLSVEELKELENYVFSQLRLQEVKDWFIFRSYTGLAYNEISRLQKNISSRGLMENYGLK